MNHSLAMILLLGASPAAAAVLPSTPATFAAVFANAKGGDTIKLAPGDYGTVITFRSKPIAFTPPLTIDASAKGVTATSMFFENFSGLVLQGPNITGDATTRSGLQFTKASNIVVNDATVANALRSGIGISMSDNVTVNRAYITKGSSDGIDISSSKHVVIDTLTCADFVPSTGAHADCVQGYSSGGQYAPDPLSYITVKNSLAVGNSTGNAQLQGFDMFGNRIPADHIDFSNNIAMVTSYWGFSMTDSEAAPCRDCTFLNNKAYTMQGSIGIIKVNPLATTPNWTGKISGNSGNSARPPALRASYEPDRHLPAGQALKVAHALTAANQTLDVEAGADLAPWKRRLDATGPFPVSISGRVYLCTAVNPRQHSIGLSQTVRPADAATGATILVLP